LNWKAGKVKNLTGVEIWLFIAGRVLTALGVGILGMRYDLQIAGPPGLPALIVGLLLLIVAAKGLFRASRTD